jgi:hypothetical protein
MLHIKRLNEHELDASSVRNTISELRLGLSNLGFKILNMPMEKPSKYQFKNASKDLLKDEELNESVEADALIAGYPNLANSKINLMVEVIGSDVVITFNSNSMGGEDMDPDNITFNNTERITFNNIGAAKIIAMIGGLVR